MRGDAHWSRKTTGDGKKAGSTACGVHVQQRILPARRNVKPGERVQVLPFVELYGYRGRDPRVYYLSPWEFVMFWAAEDLQPPIGGDADDRLTEWTAEGAMEYKQQMRDGAVLSFVPGIHYTFKKQL